MNISNKICWLCFGNHDKLLEIYGKKGIDLNVGAILQEHFWFEVGTFGAKNICGTCWKKVESFHVFYNFVKTIHKQQISEAKTIIDNGFFKEEPIDIKDAYTDVADTTDFPALDESKVENNTSKGPARLSHRTWSVRRAHLASSDFKDSISPISDKVKVDRGTSKRPAVSHKNPVFPVPKMVQLEVDSNTAKGLATVAHKSPTLKRTILASESTIFAKRSDELEADSSTIKGLATAKTWNAISDPRTSLISQYFNMACDLCDTSFSSFSDAKKHYKDVHDIRRGYLICTICKTKYARLNVMVSHCEWHINPDAFKCNQCSTTYPDKYKLGNHLIFMHAPKNEKLIDCNQCNQKFKLLQELLRHKREHHKPLLKCPVCYKCFTGKIVLRHHIRDHHSPELEQEFRSKRLTIADPATDEAKKFQCDICSSRFTYLSHLRNHINRIHVDRNSYICEICAKPFLTAHNYKLHYISVHTNQLKELKKLQCDICGKWFKNKASIAKHMYLHKSKTATCKVCGRVSSNQLTLNRHIQRLHKETTSFECVVCGKKFKEKILLKEHMAIHLGVTDLYYCTFCPKTFRSHANMYSHRKRTHPVELEEIRKNKEIWNRA